MTTDWFTRARYGLFVHYGLYSLHEHGEWAWNREEISPRDYTALAGEFRAANFDADRICGMAVAAGMRYIVFTTMHHEGFRLYPTALSDFHIGRTPAAGRDLVGEMIDASRRHKLRIGLYHSLNNWHDRPDACEALENREARGKFVDATHARIRELVLRYHPIDILWYDGWWPFDATGWMAEEMNAMVRGIHPPILLNGRNGLAGDFATPEGHLGPPRPWRPWEACMTLNNSWGYHAGDQDWKTPAQVIDMLATCAQGCGNLLLNVGLRGDGSVPEESSRVLESVGHWLKRNGEAVFDTDPFTFDLHDRGCHRGDWNHHGPITAKGHTLYWFLRRWPGARASLGGLDARVLHARWLASGETPSFQQRGTRVDFQFPDEPPDRLCPVLCLACDRPPSLYQTGGLRVPGAAHPHYDPCPSDIAH